MLNIILPIFGDINEGNLHDYENQPLILKTVKEKPIVAWALSHIDPLPIKKRYFVICNEKYINMHHLDKLLPLYTDNEIIFVRLKHNTQGMPCSILMAMDLIDEDEPVLVTSVDQYINTDLHSHLEHFKEINCDAGCIGFQSVHPKWSYAEVNEDNIIERVVEKVPISKNALTSSYYFSSARKMNGAIMSNILRGKEVNDKYYLSSCLNELIIDGKTVAFSKIDAEDYFNFYSKERVKEFEKYLQNQSNRIKQLTSRYAKLFNAADIEPLKQMFLPEVSLEDSFTPKILGFESVVEFYTSLFNSVKILNFDPQIISLIDEDTTMIKFKLQIDDDNYEGVDILKFRSLKILSLSAYLHKIS